MSSLPKVAIVILNWNGVKYLRQFLPSVLSSTWPNLEIVLADNGSSDDSLAYVKGHFPSVRVIQNDKNYGFTGGYNKALEQVEADYLILLNSDVEVSDGWIEPVISLMESDPMIAAAAPKIRAFAEKDHFEHAGAAGGFIDHYGYPFCQGRIFYEIETDQGQYNQSKEVFWATGAALFVKKRCWVESGGFDDRFFAHMEEIDLCWRLKNMGYKVMYSAESEVFHVGGGTLNVENPFKTFLNFRNNLLLIKNNLPFWRGLWVIFIRMWLDLIALARFLGEGKRKDAWAVSRAHQNFMFRTKRSAIPKSVRQSRRHAGEGHSLTGMYKRSIVWDFFLNKKRRFTELDEKDFY